ncbi:MAG: serine/threonine-protein kinase [Phycisphaeraceae bacterium]|nr:serine/threonine-protein kinase [Phycisphaeraceae bacterium]MCB9847203.1 serine/threonine-protein kinase [Phycisphaeraceae bacterium]
MTNPPSQIGPYTIDREIGRGGMGVVYLGHDTRLGRNVAIKALPQELAADPARLERFEREARVLAQLNHPNIAGIHGVEEHDGARYLVLEHVQGETLADRLDRGPLPIDEAIEIAVQIAAGIEAAHEAGVIHRDLKPGNVMVTPDGRAKVLDFGLARTEEGQSSTSQSEAATLTSPAIAHSPTIPGVILGTAAYMSPEQARGRRVDKRTDIWSFGVVLYEMCTGVGPFIGETVTDSIGAILHKNIDLNELPPQTPTRVRRVITRCLQRDKQKRLRDIGDAIVELQSETDYAPTLTAAAPASRMPWLIAAAAIILAVVGFFGSSLLSTSAPEPPRSIVKFTFAPLEDPGVAGDRFAQGVLLSPDASMVAYNLANTSWGASDTIWIRRLDQLNPRSIKLPFDAYPVCWSPGGRSLVVRKGGFINSELWSVGINGAAPRLIGALPKGSCFLWKQGVAPLDDNMLLVSMARSGIYTMPLRGGIPEPLLTTSDTEFAVCATPLPGTSAILFADTANGRLETLVNGKRMPLFDLDGDRIENVSYSNSGHILVSIWDGRRKRGVWAIPFKPESLDITGEPFWILPFGDVSCSATGAMAFCPREAQPPEPRSLVWVNEQGEIEGDNIGTPLLEAGTPQLTADAGLIALAATSDSASEIPDLNIFVVNTHTGARYELDDDRGNDYWPQWRDDDASIIYSSWNAGIRDIRRRAADGSDQPTTIASPGFGLRVPENDAYALINNNELYTMRKGESDMQLFDPTLIDSFDVSSDGRFIACATAETPGVRILRYPDGGGLTTVTLLKADGVRFNHDDTRLTFWHDGALMSVSLDCSGSLPIVGSPERLFEAEPNRLVTGDHYDVAPDGRFLMIQRPSESSATHRPHDILIIQNWAAGYEAEPRTGN